MNINAKAPQAKSPAIQACMTEKRRWIICVVCAFKKNRKKIKQSGSNFNLLNSSTFNSYLRPYVPLQDFFTHTKG